MNIQNIWAIGRNYSEHAKEMGASLPKEPMIFLKAGSSLIAENQEIELPFFSNEIHHEIEIALQFNENLEFDKVALAIDFTARDIQNKLKSQGLPWTLAKSFKHACAISRFYPIKSVNEIESFEFLLKNNGRIRQHGFAKDMIFKPNEIAKYLKSRFPVVPGDLLLTGTPEGVGPVLPGEQIEAEIIGKFKALWKIKSA